MKSREVSPLAGFIWFGVKVLEIVSLVMRKGYCVEGGGRRSEIVERLLWMLERLLWFRWRVDRWRLS